MKDDGYDGVMEMKVETYLAQLCLREYPALLGVSGHNDQITVHQS